MFGKSVAQYMWKYPPVFQYCHAYIYPMVVTRINTVTLSCKQWWGKGRVFTFQRLNPVNVYCFTTAGSTAHVSMLPNTVTLSCKQWWGKGRVFTFQRLNPVNVYCFTTAGSTAHVSMLPQARLTMNGILCQPRSVTIATGFYGATTYMKILVSLAK